jgi:hypothetical protein
MKQVLREKRAEMRTREEVKKRSDVPRCDALSGGQTQAKDGNESTTLSGRDQQRHRADKKKWRP